MQPGHNLWTLAREHYGSGVLYTQIFTANRDLIRDPDLIYPGQIFAMPARGRGRLSMADARRPETSGASGWRTIRRVAPYLWPRGRAGPAAAGGAGDGRR